MPVIQPTSTVKNEIRSFINELLNYSEELDRLSTIQIDAKWDKEKLKIKTTIDRLLPLFPAPKESRTQNKQISHLRYLLIQILDKRLKILRDASPKNDKGKRQGIGKRVFILKFWHPPTEDNYINLNLRALERHWNKTYKIDPKTLVPNNLPPLAHPQLIGRKRNTEREDLINLLTQPREGQQIITIVGMAGVGKTTLALVAAHECLESNHFAAIIFSSAQAQTFRGANLVERIAERNLQDLFQVIFTTLNRADELPFNLEEQHRSILALLVQQSTLIVLDNIEDIIEQTDILTFFTNLPPTVKVIITSRVRPKIGRIIDLQPLNVTDSMELIKYQVQTQNLKISSSQFTPIQRSTGGVPVAINYLIGLMATGGTELVGESPQPPLTAGDFARYCFSLYINLIRTIPDSIAEQLLFSLSLFPDGASTTALTYLNPECGHLVSPGLEQLKRISLVSLIAPDLYQIHSLTQAYAQLELDRQPDYAITLRNRWQNWYLDLVAPYERLDWLDWLDYSPLIAEWKNLRGVVDWCIQQEQYEDVLHFWHCLKGMTLLGGYWSQRQQWLEWLQGMAEERGDLQTIAELKYHQSYTFAFQDETDSSGKAMELALAAWEMQQSLDFDLQFDLVMYIGSLHIRKLPKGDATHLAAAQTWLDLGTTMLASHPRKSPQQPRHNFQVHYYQAEIQFVSGKITLAYDNYLCANQLAKKHRFKRFFFASSARMGIILIHQGKLPEAEERFKNALKLTSKYQDRRGATFCQKNLADVNKAMGNPTVAKKYAQQAKDGFDSLGMNREAAMMEKFLQEL
jgi:tetratricopeptide (TPR) repeat protein/ABC-type dipeptide/oligopeptide/nickel transport system ATPase subunit